MNLERTHIWHNRHIVEAFLNAESVAVHQKSKDKGKHTTVDKHMPIAHQKKAQWSAERFINWGKSIGKKALTTWPTKTEFKQPF